VSEELSNLKDFGRQKLQNLQEEKDDLLADLSELQSQLGAALTENDELKEHVSKLQDVLEASKRESGA